MSFDGRGLWDGVVLLFVWVWCCDFRFVVGCIHLLGLSWCVFVFVDFVLCY